MDGSDIHEGVEVPEISMTNTKKEMMDAYRRMRNLLEAKPLPLPSPEVEREASEKREAIEAADAVVEEDTPRRIADLRHAIGQELAALASRLDTESQAYERMKRAVEAKKAELQHAYEVETAAVDLAALIEAQRQKRESFETEISSARAAWVQERQDAEARLAAEREAMERKRLWESEEFEYTLKRERSRRKNELDDELGTLERQVQQARDEAEREREERRAQFKERDSELSVRELHMSELEQRVAGFPAELKSAVAEAVAAREAQIGAEFAAHEALLTKDFEGSAPTLEGGSLRALAGSTAIHNVTVEAVWSALQAILDGGDVGGGQVGL